MKTHKIILSFFTMCTAMVIISACSTKDLELVNPNQLSPDTFFVSQAQVEASVNAVYANLQTGGLFVRMYVYSMDLMGADAAENPQLEPNNREFARFTFNSNSGNIGDYWESCYRGINKANFVIGNAERIHDAPISQEQADKYIAEAHFMRALYYFFLVIRFGDIPLITEIPTSDAGFPKSPKQAVYDQIVSDLEIASTNLLSKSVEVKGRATKETAIAMLGKVYLYQEEYDLALIEFEKIYGAYSLEPEYFDNFKEETEYGVESIFEVAFNEAVSANPWVSGVSGDGAGEVTLRGQDYGFADWFNTYPAQDLLDEYDSTDPRLNDNYYFLGDSYGVSSDSLVVTTAQLTVLDDGVELLRPAGWKKYQNYYKRNNENMASSINFRYLRYADVLLMMAECENQRPGGDQDAAIGYINQVRQRPSTNMPALPLGMPAPDVFEAIVSERRMELAGEQLRFSDLVRWGRAETELAGQGFDANTHYLWPIPAREISSNPEIGEEDQNPGY